MGALMTQNDDMLLAATAGKHFDGGCHCGQVRFRTIGPLGKLLICHCSDCMRIAGMSWGATDVAFDRFELLRDDGLKWYDSSAIAKRGFCGNCGSSLFYKLHSKPVIAIAPGVFDNSDMLEVAGQIYAASHPGWGPCDSQTLPHLDEMWDAKP